jgi:hypothetical protein
MNFNQTQHDLKNALLFLETFPLIIKTQIQKNDAEALDELLAIYDEKIKILRLWIKL